MLQHHKPLLNIKVPDNSPLGYFKDGRYCMVGYSVLDDHTASGTITPSHTHTTSLPIPHKLNSPLPTDRNFHPEPSSSLNHSLIPPLTIFSSPFPPHYPHNHHRPVTASAPRRTNTASNIEGIAFQVLIRRRLWVRCKSQGFCG